ncbi:MAG: S-methyl-5-thioribose-1-phosphate isomerase [Spirochaetes bacterium GWF1_51_8]|nr:MAG: S-methyl-5-thioribose-1-phosphate isomerase [Spirochaetes bacterium GWF1_51_8]
MNNPVVDHIRLEGETLVLLDQRLLPGEEKYLRIRTSEEVFDAIRTLAVRGAPAIGVAAAYGIYVHLANFKSARETEALRAEAERAVEYIKSSRPTAYNLFYALDRQLQVIRASESSDRMLDGLRTEALSIHREDLESSERIGEYGAEFISDGMGIISHCNAGGLATGGNGTSLAVIFRAQRDGKKIKVYVDETRPLLQGSRLTAWELERAGVPYEIITDSMAGDVMRKGLAQAVLLGADRIARNGDFANKIGTYSLAVLAKYHGIPFYTAAPASTFDLSLANGGGIVVEQRSREEVLGFAGIRTSPMGAKAYNPAFDVTPSELVTAIISDRGGILPPFERNIENMFRQATK